MAIVDGYRRLRLGLAGVHPLALVLFKLLAQAFLGVRCAVQYRSGNLEVRGTIRADSNGRHGAEPLDDPETTLLRGGSGLRHTEQFSFDLPHASGRTQVEVRPFPCKIILRRMLSG